MINDQFRNKAHDQRTSVNPLKPKIKIGILNCCPYSFSTEVVGRS